MATILSMFRAHRLLMVVIALVTVTVAGCNNREPPTMISINLLDTPGRVVYNGEEMGITTAKRELSHLADRRRNTITNTSTGVRVVITALNGANDVNALKLADYCRSVGLNSIQFQAR